MAVVAIVIGNEAKMLSGARRALVIGASGGIGRAVAATLLQMDFGVALVGRDPDKLKHALAECGPVAQGALVLPCDVTDRTQVQTMVEQALDEMGFIDLVVFAAGVNVRQRSLRSLDPADWDRVISTNLTGVYNVLHFVLPSMRTRGRGLIVQISSLSGLRASTVSGVAYSAAKFGQSALGICLGREERGRGIRSTVIHAGEVNTALLDVRAGRPGDAGCDSRRQNILQPAEIAATVRFLADLPGNAHVPELVIKPTIDDFS
jgi:NADP-dependent 3-hydroxy acid dehydrogenase YdfG